MIYWQPMTSEKCFSALEFFTWKAYFLV